MTRISLFAALAALALCASTATALADEATAKQRYEDGEHAYNLGQFQKAIELFTKAYEEWPEPAFLFNIAQAYRQAGDCKQALFFYKRFLALKQNDTKKPIKPAIKDEVEGRITELEECVKREIASKPPDSLDNGMGGSGSTTISAQPAKTPPATTPATTTTAAAKPATTATTTDASGNDDGDDDDSSRVTRRGPFKPHVLSARVTAGAAKLGAGNLDTPMQPSIALFAGYPLQLTSKLELDLGPAFTYTAMPYGTTSSGDGTASLVAIVADAGLAATVAPHLALRGDLGLGVQVMSGLEKSGNPFTTDGSPATGSLSTFLARVAASAEYAVTNNIIVTATPFAFAYAPAPSGFLSSISSLTTLSFLVGVGYRQ